MGWCGCLRSIRRSRLMSLRTLASAHAHFDGYKVRDFVPLLVERMAGEKLSSLVAS